VALVKLLVKVSPGGNPAEAVARRAALGSAEGLALPPEIDHVYPGCPPIARKVTV
jgi:hypothetical protein